MKTLGATLDLLYMVTCRFLWNLKTPLYIDGSWKKYRTRKMRSGDYDIWKKKMLANRLAFLWINKPLKVASKVTQFIHLIHVWGEVPNTIYVQSSKIKSSVTNDHWATLLNSPVLISNMKPNTLIFLNHN